MWSWDTKPNANAQRKFMALVFNRTEKYPNWDPLSEIPVGSYGRIDSATGNLDVQGSIYSDDFKQRLIDVGINLESGEHLPEECPEESEFTTWSKNVRKIELDVDSHAVPGITTAAIKGTWQVLRKDTIGAVLLMSKPRMKHITPHVLGKLARIQLLQDVHLVTKAFYCPAFSFYLSDTSGESFSIALLGSAPVLAPVGTVDAMDTMRWWSDKKTGLRRNGCKTEPCFNPLYQLLHVRHHRYTRRISPSPERTGEQAYIAPGPPWAPLSEDGTEVPICIYDSDSEEE
ncbi:hypothetical protein DFH29DRAFT_950834 [Suillus ampliporus]|nr:hypothetical protein DFH29DRAFT_950834 [Suillus ampliporus]